MLYSITSVFYFVIPSSVSLIVILEHRYWREEKVELLRCILILDMFYECILEQIDNNTTTKLGSPVLHPPKHGWATSLNLRVVGGPSIQPRLVELHDRVSGCTSTLPMAKAFESLTRFIFSCSRAVLEGAIQVNPVSSLYYKPSESFNSKIDNNFI
jgi:hypothetical protein